MGIRLEVLEFFDGENRSLIHRIPQQGSADIKLGAQLIVQENQEALFFRDGKALDTFSAGRHTLVTANVPILTRLLTIPWEKSPFQAQVYFVGKQTFLDQKWGTREPITLRDKEFGMVRLRAFGKFSYRVADSTTLINTLVGTQGKYTTDDTTNYLKDQIVSRLTDLLASSGVSLLDFPQHFDEIATCTKAKVQEDFSRYGLELVDFFVNSISPPEEVQRAIDARSSMGAIGDLQAFTMYQAANSMSKLAESGGAGGSDAMSMGMGAGFGMMMPGLIQQTFAGAAKNQPSSALPGSANSAAVAAAAQSSASRFDPGQFEAIKPDPKQLVRSVAQSAGWTIAESSDSWHLTVPVGSLRKQKVRVHFGRKDKEGHAMISISSLCGPSIEKNALPLLRYNTKLLHGAFAIEKTSSGEMVVIVANLLAATADPLELTRVVTAIAWQADDVETKLTSEDNL